LFWYTKFKNYFKKIILMYFDIKNILKNNYNYIFKQILYSMGYFKVGLE